VLGIGPEQQRPLQALDHAHQVPCGLGGIYPFRRVVCVRCLGEPADGESGEVGVGAGGQLWPAAAGQPGPGRTARGSARAPARGDGWRWCARRPAWRLAECRTPASCRSRSGPGRGCRRRPGHQANGSLDGEGRSNARCGQCVSQWHRHAERRKGGAVRRVRGSCTPAFPAQGRNTFDGLSCHEGRLPDLGGRISRAATSVEPSSLTERCTTGAP
jgi:hypothetical protein